MPFFHIIWSKLINSKNIFFDDVTFRYSIGIQDAGNIVKNLNSVSQLLFLKK